MFKEMLKDVWPLLEKSAPMIASALGAPSIGLPAMIAINALGSKFNGNNISDSMKNDPACEDKLCQLENVFSQFFKNPSQQLPLPNGIEVNVKINWEKD